MEVSSLPAALCARRACVLAVGMAAYEWRILSGSMEKNMDQQLFLD